MARAIQSIGKVILLHTQNLVRHLQCQSSIAALSQCRRFSYAVASQMRKSAIDGKMLRLLRNEIQYEFDRSPLQQPPGEINGFKAVERPGEQWISLEKHYGENEDIKVEVTMFDGSFSVPKEGEKSGLPGQEVQLRTSMIVSIFKRNSNQVLEFICSVWPDTLAISKLFVREQATVPHQPYTGPKFRELDDELQYSLYEFLEERGIDDSLCIFLHKYINYKEKAEYIRWMKSVKLVLEK